MLDSIAINLESESEAATKRMVIILEPLMIVVMAVLIGFVVAAVMLPIYQSYSCLLYTSEYQWQSLSASARF